MLVTRTRQVGIALAVIALANTALVLATLPRPPRLSAWMTLIVCGGGLTLAYHENTAAFHRSVSAWEAVRIVLGLFLVLAAVISVQLLWR